MQKLLPLIAILVLSSTEAKAQECSADNSVVKTVRRVADNIIAADNSQEIEKVIALYATDAVLLPPNEAPVSGHAAIKSRYEPLFANFKPQIESRIDEVCVDQKTAFVRGHNGGSLVPIAGGDFRRLDDTYLMLLRREKDGVWRISHLMWHRSR
jgi:uncharacterized protein (TIGR02246 family)